MTIKTNKANKKGRQNKTQARAQTQTFDKGMPEVDARKVDIVRAECERIRRNDSDGVLHPEAMVEAARPVNSVMHPMFEWDDKIGGELHRISQARQIIRVFIIHSRSDDESNGALSRKAQRIYLSPPDQRSMGGGYLTFDQVKGDSDRRKQMARQLVNDIRRLSSSPQYVGFDELQNLLREISIVADKWWWKLELGQGGDTA